MATNFLCIITGIIGLVTTLLIFTSYKSNRVMNLYIILLILIISFRHLIIGLTYFISDDSFKDSFYKYSNFSAVAIPLFYLYLKNLSSNNKYFDSKELLHFIFPTTFFLFIIKFNDFQHPSIRLKLIFYTIFFAYTSFYIILCYRLLKKNIWTREVDIKVINKQNELINNWTLFLFIVITLITIRLLVSILLEIYYNIYIKGISYQWISALIWLLILFKILISPEILYGYGTLYRKINENRSSNLELNEIWNISSNSKLNNSQHLVLKEKIDKNILVYIEEIEKLSFKYELFRDPKMTITDLANKLNIPKSHISYIFKYHSTISFSEYKKVIRIHDAIKHIELNYLKNNTLDSLSKKVGFTSYNPFFTSFKEVSGVSPLEYYKMTKVEIDE
ncbi:MULTISPECIES: helix-turn-helix domain-containing protein [Flavobacterium]|uniref:Helix-turn-helix transcriptional regulator n=1 Tax=Flavobacterium gawalongense TaxID=2594432 RepID=A0A553B9F7_9FLAO|nr:AraC family transcriptional regulator [Flavobacterium gawalongense]TRW96120.1 helix-turn-helix transcriptional regulator [Flavobacterium gawalongense]TRX00869.1 helix-turn-helix transcriptional regulator [Flavobacterium gawalongense]TRX04867.1 helix-turn-helix transcriptional regulator [Flavobacterium gawalongense]TRX05559.1 helix-turn-helix transcriptional regulator [Flavobacterium gawalongense]TRX21427.1 helix-turn-helix transcriptional regulator [Flavobacterium gawalongense]